MASQVRMAGASTSSRSALPSGRLDLLLPGMPEGLCSGCLPAAGSSGLLTLDRGVGERDVSPRDACALPGRGTPGWMEKTGCSQALTRTRAPSPWP